MTKNILFSNKMLVLLQKYTKKGETHTYPLAFPPFWAYPMSCFETILFRHSGFPGTANAPPGHLVPPLLGAAGPGPHYAAAKSQAFPPACMPLGKMTQNLRLPVGYARSIRGERVSSIACSLPPCMGQKNPGHPLRRFRRKRPFIPAAAAPAGRAGALAAKWRCDPLPRRPAL